MSWSTATIATCSVLFSVTPAIAQSAWETFSAYPESGVQLGNGWDSFRGSKTLANCVIAKSTDDSGQKREIHYTEVSDISSLLTAFSVSVGAKVGGITGASGSAAASFSRTIKIDTTKLNIAADIRIVEGASYLVPVGVPSSDASGSGAQTGDMGSIPSIRLTEAAVRLAREDPINFRSQCGDVFVSTIRKESGIQGLFTVNTRTYNEKLELGGKIDAAGGPFGGGADLKQRMERLDQASQISVQYYQLGGASLPVATNQKEFQELVYRIGEAANSANASPFEVGLMPYQRLSNFPNGATEDATKLADMADEYYRLYSLDSQIDAILTGDDYAFDKKVTRGTVASVQDAIKVDMALLKKALQNCSNSPSTCMYPPTASTNDYEFRMAMPVHKTSVKSWNDLQTFQQNLKTAEAHLQSLTSLPVPMEQLPIQAGEDPHPTATARADLKKAQDQVDEMKANFDTTEERFEYWIELPVRERCRVAERLCLNNEELSAIHDAMFARKSLPATVPP
jgi:hypothetical protein